MGIQAWITVGRVLLWAASGAVFTGGVSLIAHQINDAILKNDFEIAKLMLKDLSWRYKQEYEQFIKKYKKDLPDEFFNEMN